MTWSFQNLKNQNKEKRSEKAIDEYFVHSFLLINVQNGCSLWIFHLISVSGNAYFLKHNVIINRIDVYNIFCCFLILMINFVFNFILLFNNGF